jgi:hypothetical protein
VMDLLICTLPRRSRTSYQGIRQEFGELLLPLTDSDPLAASSFGILFVDVPLLGIGPWLEVARLYLDADAVSP